MKTILFSASAMALFFGFYWLTLRRSNLFRLRRFYLVGTLALALVLPFVSIEMPSRVAALVQSTTTGTTLTTGEGQSTTTGTTLTTGAVEATTTGTTQTTVVGQSTTIETTLTTGATETTKAFAFKDLLWWGYVLGCGAAFILLVVKLFKTFRYYRRSVLSDELSTGDMCVRVLQWFNPVIYLYAKELSSVHEFLADEAVLSCGVSRRDYLELLYKQLCVESSCLWESASATC